MLLQGPHPPWPQGQQTYGTIISVAIGELIPEKRGNTTNKALQLFL
jgi:hypothetical protein